MLTDTEASVTKLREVLGELGHQLQHTDCLDVISKTIHRPNAQLSAERIGDDQKIAEQYLDELLEGFVERDYSKFTQRFEEKYLVLLPESEFNREIADTFGDFGKYLRRDFMGCVGVIRHPDDDRFPDESRYVWRMYFEKNDSLLRVGIYQKNGTYYINSADNI